MEFLVRSMTHTTSKWIARTALIYILLAATLYTPVVTAQSGIGLIEGTVQDASHAVIPNAMITVVNNDTGLVTTTKSNRVGFYQVPGLFVGTYAVTISAPNMKTYKTSIHLLVAQSAVISPIMTPGAVTQQVVVSGNTVQLTDTVDGTISSTLENQRINQLPENGRLLETLVGMTTPGAEGGGQLFNGLAAETSDYIEDGVSTENLIGGGASGVEDPDSVQEVRLQAADAGAQYATPAAAVITTKSGTNSLHGTFFETSRNNAIGIAKSRSDPSNFTAPAYIRNEFGLSAGGPIILPHVYHGKNKSFWFFAYERYSLAQMKSIESRVATPAMRQGDFSGAYNAQDILQTIFDPATTAYSGNCSYTNAANSYCRTPFPNNQIPASEISPTAKILYDIIPQPSTTDNPLVAPNLISPAGIYQVTPQFNFRIDHEFSDNDRAYLRFSDYNGQTNITPQGQFLSLAADGIPAGAANGYNDGPTVSFASALGYSHVFSSTFFSETILSQEWLNSWGVRGTARNVDYETMLGLPNNFGELGFPNFAGDGFSSLFGSQKTFGQNQINSAIDQNFTKVHGLHQLLFGGRFRHVRFGSEPGQATDSFAFTGLPTAIYNTKSGQNYTALPNTGLTAASFLMGSASNYTVTLQPPYVQYRAVEYDAYVQDNYRVRRNLTLSIGLRYEGHPSFHTAGGVANTLDLNHDALVLAAPPSKLIAEGYTTQAIITNDENIGVKFETPAEAGMPANSLMES